MPYRFHLTPRRPSLFSQVGLHVSHPDVQRVLLVFLFVFSVMFWLSMYCSPTSAWPEVSLTLTGQELSGSGEESPAHTQRLSPLSAAVHESYHLETEGNTTCGEHAYFKIIIIQRCNFLNVESLNQMGPLVCLGFYFFSFFLSLSACTRPRWLNEMLIYSVSSFVCAMLLTHHDFPCAL